MKVIVSHLLPWQQQISKNCSEIIIVCREDVYKCEHIISDLIFLFSIELQEVEIGLSQFLVNFQK